MVKRLSAVIAVFLVLTVSLSASQLLEKKLLGMTPAGSEIVLSADLTDLLSFPAFKKSMTEGRDISEFSKNTGLAPSDLGALLFWAKGEDMALLVAFAKAFDPQKVFAEPQFKIQKIQGPAGTFFKVRTVKVPAAAKKKLGIRSTAFCVAQLPGNVAAFFKDENVAASVLNKMKGKVGFAYDARLKGALRGMYKGGQQLPVTSALLSCAMKDKTKGDLDIFISAKFNSEEEALAAKEQVTMVISLLMMQVMQQDPDLAAELMKCLKVDISGKELFLKSRFAGDLLERTAKFAEEFQKKKKAAAKRRKASKRKPIGPVAP